MGTDLQIALVQAACHSDENSELYWIFSRTQVEFVVKELDLFDPSSSRVLARYQDTALPVISLEDYFGLQKKSREENRKYIVLRLVDENRNVKKIIVEAGFSPQFVKLTHSFTSLTGFSMPKNSDQIRGAYSLGERIVGVVPNVGTISLGLV